MAQPYTTKGLSPPPDVSKTTIPMSGLLVDVYGLNELPDSVPVTCLHLLHTRHGTRARMSDIACRVISAYIKSSKTSSSRGLIAVAFDMPNHGSRMVSEKGNETWQKGNENHAIDMMAMVTGSVRDMAGVMDLLEAYIGREVDAHVCLGWSLGGHAAWQGWMKEDRLDAVVVVVGCPDFMELMNRRANDSHLDLKDGEAFLGSKYLPPSLIASCLKNDPRGLLFGQQPPSLSGEMRPDFDFSGLRGKKLLLLSGGSDKLVPHSVGAPFIEAIMARGFDVEDMVYDGVGHAFSKDMVHEAVDFLVEQVTRGPRKAKAKM